jgi:hypothetical protein
LTGDHPWSSIVCSASSAWRDVDQREALMTDSVYKVIELVGTSTDSWERAAASAIDQASSTLRGLRVAEVRELDVALDEGGAKTYRAKLSVSFKYEGGD